MCLSGTSAHQPTMECYEKWLAVFSKEANTWLGLYRAGSSDGAKDETLNEALSRSFGPGVVQELLAIDYVTLLALSRACSPLCSNLSALTCPHLQPLPSAPPAGARRVLARDASPASTVGVPGLVASAP